MFSTERRRLIRQIVQERRRLTFVELQALVPPCSAATLRRDLEELERAGALIRTHGGMLDPALVRAEPSFDERVGRDRVAKKLIAEAAARLVPPGASVFVDAGSTCLEAGRLLAARGDVRIVTHSAALVGAALHGQAGLLCIGGELRKVSGAFTGGATLGALKQLRVEVALVGASGLHRTEGAWTTELSEAEIKRTAIARAGRTILLADVSKWEKPSTVHFADWEACDDWVTDLPPAPSDTGRLAAVGTKIHDARAK